MGSCRSSPTNKLHRKGKTMKKLLAFLLVVSIGLFFAIGCKKETKPPAGKTGEPTAGQGEKKTTEAPKAGTETGTPKEGGPTTPATPAEPKAGEGAKKSGDTTPPPEPPKK